MISRRELLKRGGAVTVWAGISGSLTRSALAPEVSAAAALSPQSSPTDPLSGFSMATFVDVLKSTFQLSYNGQTEPLVLTRVIDLTETGPTAPSGECFSLRFRANGVQRLAQGTYPLQHPTLGAFRLLLVPAGAPSDHAPWYYEAVINRQHP